MRRLAAAWCFVLVACSGANASDGLSVFAAASLTDVFAAIAPGARFNFAGSDQLATQIREGALADVYAAASPKYPAQLFAEHLVEQPVVFATNRLVLIVPAANPARISSVADLRRAGTKLVVGAPAVPVGDYTRSVLKIMNASDVLHNVVSEEPDVKEIVGKIALGEADAGFVYATDVAPAAARVKAIELPAQPGITFTVAVLARAPRERAARTFIATLLGAQGRRALTDAGFGVP